MKKKRDNGLLMDTYEVERLESQESPGEYWEVEKITIGSETWFEDAVAYANDAWDRLRADTLDFDTYKAQAGITAYDWGWTQFAIATDSPTEKSLGALKELRSRLLWYKKKPHDAHAYEIGKAEILLRALMDSPQVEQGQKNITGREGGYKTKREKRKVTDALILEVFDAKEAKHADRATERELCAHAAAELNRAVKSGDKKLISVLVDLNKEEFTTEMVRFRVQRRKKESG